jgi:FAD/FMN-containing dehydrogenase
MDERPTGMPDGRDVARLRGALEGPVLLPGEDAYDQARRVWNAMVDRRPAIIARCASPADVAAAVRFGREHDLELGVRCGGHSVLGISVPAGGLMVDLTPMQAVRVDPERRRAWVQGGSLLRNLDRTTQPFGLATTAGNVSHTGVGGLTLGGGMGWLARLLGLACDNVARFELVTADGEIMHASETENADLYWGLRGGGGNFGVVTEFEFRLHPVGTAALLVELYHAPDHAPAALRRWRDLLPDAPRQATLTAWAGTSGEAPFLPPELHGRPLVNVGYVWVGDPEEGRALPAPVRRRGDRRVRLARGRRRRRPRPGKPALRHAAGLRRRDRRDRRRRHRLRAARHAGGIRGRRGLDRPGHRRVPDRGGAALRRGDRAVRQWRVRELPDRRRRGRHAAGLRLGQAGTARRGEGALRPRQHLPSQPQHPPPPA